MGALSDLGAAGPVLGVLAALSILSVAVILARLIALRSATATPESWIETLERGEQTSAPPPDTPAGRVAGRAVALIGRGAQGPQLSTGLLQAGNVEVAKMHRGIRLLELIAMIAPLLGLLGTVLGMIQSFRSLELAEGAANASILAGGIWQALLTTAAGLLVAIPAAVGAAILQARAEAGTQAIETMIGRAILARELPERGAG